LQLIGFSLSPVSAPARTGKNNAATTGFPHLLAPLQLIKYFLKLANEINYFGDFLILKFYLDI